LAACAALALAIGGGDARPARSANVTISMLITNFERVYPNITVNATYLPSGTLINQTETTQLAGGNAPDLLAASPGCGQPLSICELAKDGYLSPLLNEPWAKRSPRLVISRDKYGQGLFAFTPAVDPEGIFTNDTLFKKLGLTIPQTFPQLLTLCQKAKADGTAALVFAGGTPFTTFMAELSVGTVYAKDKTWLAELKAGKATFEGTAGWHQALQEVIDMSNAGCFQPGALGTSSSGALVDFAQGQGLMTMQLCSFKGLIDMDGPQFAYSFHLFPGGTSPTQIRTLVNLSASIGINAHSSAANQAAAKAFIDFIARPKQNALYTQLIGGLTQYQFLKQQTSSFMGSDVATMIKDGAWVINPLETFWNASVLTVLQQDGAGLLTGQVSIDDFLNAMDAAWKQGPS
jgi:raffinose/stachyose/melibiose transport system substrate-binding protein